MSANGPLRVLPGTHRHGILSDADLDHVASAVDAVECTTSAGGVVEMRLLTVHASSKAQSDVPRRVIHVEYAASVSLDHDIELAVG